MDKKPDQNLKLLYVGSAPETIEELKACQNFELSVKENSITALNYLERNAGNIDAIISELYLPGNNGIDLKSLLVSQKLGHKKPFIIVAHEVEAHKRQNAIENNVDDFFQMPLDIEKIYRRILFLKNKPDFVSHEDTAIGFQNYSTPLLKRSFDILVAGGTLLFAGIPLLLIMLAIRLESKGKAFYVSKRMGANFRIFDFYKLRSMYPDADKRLKEVEHLNQYVKEDIGECEKCAALPEGKYCSPVHFIEGNAVCENMANREKKRVAFMKIENDPRITKVGKFIRNTSIDELPQLINILKGDMSIVGNRPLPLGEAYELTRGDRAKRFFTAAGLTGLWQVELRGRGGDMSEEERFDLDNQYAANNSFWGDINLILRTFKIFIQRKSV